eukprot:NODE_24509_length_622_cov_2.028283.p2 GENE.NODE_24509_length_622_cov_2.028283~~NODE_24509_length_622_cov_2.028283.p2  ORF type:complete len:78 (+),score=20.51 NODE_24509_length_622_cov_2.028283:300-533(+)
MPLQQTDSCFCASGHVVGLVNGRSALLRRRIVGAKTAHAPHVAGKPVVLLYDSTMMLFVGKKKKKKKKKKILAFIQI